MPVSQSCDKDKEYIDIQHKLIFDLDHVMAANLLLE